MKHIEGKRSNNWKKEQGGKVNKRTTKMEEI